MILRSRTESNFKTPMRPALRVRLDQVTSQQGLFRSNIQGSSFTRKDPRAGPTENSGSPAWSLPHLLSRLRGAERQDSLENDQHSNEMVPAGEPISSPASGLSRGMQAGRTGSRDEVHSYESCPEKTRKAGSPVERVGSFQQEARARISVALLGITCLSSSV